MISPQWKDQHVTRNGYACTETAPRVVKLFANRTSLGFSDAGDIEPTQTIELTDDDLEPSKEIELRFVKFQRVKSVTVSVVYAILCM